MSAMTPAHSPGPTAAPDPQLADWLATTGKNLTEVYITHAHGDHFFGLNTVLDKFPKARAVVPR